MTYLSVEEAAIKYPEQIEYCHSIHELYQLEIVENNSYYIDAPQSKWCQIKELLSYYLEVRNDV